MWRAHMNRTMTKYYDVGSLVAHVFTPHLEAHELKLCNFNFSWHGLWMNFKLRALKISLSRALTMLQSNPQRNSCGHYMMVLMILEPRVATVVWSELYYIILPIFGSKFKAKHSIPQVHINYYDVGSELLKYIVIHLNMCAYYNTSMIYIEYVLWEEQWWILYNTNIPTLNYGLYLLTIILKVIWITTWGMYLMWI